MTWLKTEIELREPLIALVRPEGRMVLGRESQELELKLQKLILDQQKLIVIDLAGVTHIDSTGVGILVMSFGKAKAASAELRVAGATGNIAEVLRLTKIGQIIPIFATAEEALKLSATQTAKS